MGGFELKLATRHLWTGGGQTLLTVGSVAAGVVVVVFFSSLIFGIRARMSSVLTEMLPMVTISPPDPTPTTLAATGVPSYGPSSSRIERHTQQTKNIDSWTTVVEQIRVVPDVADAAPIVVGQAFATRGGRRIGVSLTGADPERLVRIQQIAKYVTSGHYLGLASDEVLVNYKLKTDLDLSLGDRLFLTSSSGVTSSFRVAGILDTGQSPVDQAYVCLRQGQSLFQTGTAVSAIYVRCDDLFQADAVADHIQAFLPYKVDSWSRLYPQFVSMLAVYQAMAYAVSGFSLLASGFAIASVLIVSVIRRSQQIGILKGIGARSSQIVTLFLYESLGIAILGAAVGAALGCGIVIFLRIFKRPGAHPGVAPEDLFPSHLTWQLVALAMGAAVITTIVAAILPARRAALLNPAEVIR